MLHQKRKRIHRTINRTKEAKMRNLEVEIDEPEVDEPVTVTEEIKPRKKSRGKPSGKKPAKKKDVEPAKVDPQPSKQNGVRRPSPGTLCGQAWDIFDKLSKRGNPPDIKAALEIAKKKNLNPGNVRAEFYAFKRYHGLSGKQA
jgi:hypothetical protein